MADIDKLSSMKAALEDIHNISIGYDGYGTVKSLKKLIDELKDITKQGLLGHYHENRDSKPSLSPAKDVRGKVAPEDSSQWKCNWINCLHGCGLSGNGRCSADGEWNNMSCGKFTKIPKHLYDKPSPEPSMPLRRQFEDALHSYGCCPYDDLLNRLEAIVEAHDQQVRKAFAEECIKTMKDATDTFSSEHQPELWSGFDVGASEQMEVCIAHLRAMAEGGT